MQGPQTRQDGKADEYKGEGPALERFGIRILGEFHQVERVRARDNVGRDHSNQHQSTADERIEHEFHRAVLLVRGAPDCDQEILRNDREFVEDEEQEEQAV
jgi:hypothetical protein